MQRGKCPPVLAFRCQRPGPAARFSGPTNANWGQTPIRERELGSDPISTRIFSHFPLDVRSPMSWKRPRRLGFLVAAGALTACTSAPPTDPKMVSEWMHTLYGAIRAERLSPPVASRVMAYATTALYSGLSSTERGLRPLSGWRVAERCGHGPEETGGIPPMATRGRSALSHLLPRPHLYCPASAFLSHPVVTVRTRVRR